jgi:hypothetical protein
MEVRKVLQQHPAVATCATAVITVVAIFAIILELRGNPIPPVPTRAYYTTDDGASYYADDINLVAPYMHDGKEAVLARVLKGAGGKKYVAYLSRYNAKQKEKIEKLLAQTPVDQNAVALARESGIEVKAPLSGDHGWVPSLSVDALPIIQAPHPPDISEPLEPAYP